MIAAPRSQAERRRQLHSDNGSKAASALHRSRKPKAEKKAPEPTPAPEPKQSRCDRCSIKFPANELAPVPNWQSTPGNPQPLPVPVKGNAGWFAPGVVNKLCRPCRVSTIERKRFHNHSDE